MGSWEWGTKISFFRFPQKNDANNHVGNTAFNMQTLIGLLDDVNDCDACRITSYLKGGTGFKQFRQLVAKLLIDPRVVAVLWADLPGMSISLSSTDSPSEEVCRSVRAQLLKMLRVGAIEWNGFKPPTRSTNERANEPIASPQQPNQKVNRVRRTTAHDTDTTDSEDTVSPACEVPVTVSPPAQVQCRSISTQTDPKMFEQHTCHKSTQASTNTSTLVPLTGTYSANDRRKSLCITGLDRLRKVTPKGFHWTSLMITVLLRFVYYAVVKLNWSWSW